VARLEAGESGSHPVSATGELAVAVVAEQCLGPVPGGTGRYTRDLLAALARTAPTGAGVASWVAWHRDVQRAVVEGVGRPRRLALPRRPLTAAWERGVGPAPRSADVVHAPTLLVPPRRGRPLVVTIHDVVPWTHPDTLTARGVAFHRRMAERAAREADVIITPTDAVRDELTGLLPGARRVVTISPGLTRALGAPSDAMARAERLGLPPGGYLLTVATLEPRKGLDLLLRALARDGAPTLPLVVVGQAGWGGVDPAAIAAGLGYPVDRLRILGRVDDGDLATCYQLATAVVVPSRAEGFGLPVLEAMALGAPVITTTVPALIEVAGGAAQLAEPSPVALSAAISAVIEDPDRRARMIEMGRARAAHFDWDVAGRELWALYADLAPEPLRTV
jgi:glycosyltransferase involved in cell wall biosynthesis